ncbi:MAG: HAD-IA family hydrolase [Jatrophihabitans sp.]
MITDRESAVRGVLFDFSGTLFHIESAVEAVRAALGPDFVGRAAELDRLGAINGSTASTGMPPHLHDVWHRRDLSSQAHRAAYSGLARHAGLTAEQADALYERGIRPEAWHPYPDTVEVLSRLRDAAVPVAIVSNIGWDPRPVLQAFGVAELIHALVLSDERGVTKPDPSIFRQACTEIDRSPRECVMIGDNPEHDGAAVALGAGFVLVPADPAQRRDDELLRAARV